MYVIGITGPVGSGKSTVCGILGRLGMACIDADILGHRCLSRRSKAYQGIVEAFGDAILSSSGEIDRKKLGAVVFSSEESRRRLNAIIWPCIREKVGRKLKEISKNHTIAFLEAAVLFEAGWQDLVNEVWVTWATEEERIRRIAARDRFSVQEIKRRMRTQYSFDLFAAQGDVIIDTECAIDDLEKKVKYILESKMLIEKRKGDGA